MSDLIAPVSVRVSRWDTGSLAWVVWDGSLTTGALVIGKVDQGSAGTSPWLTTMPTSDRITEIDYVMGASPIYIGLAAAGTATSAAAWQIKKLTYSGTDVVSILYAGGSIAFTAIWDNRAALSYS